MSRLAPAPAQEGVVEVPGWATTPGELTAERDRSGAPSDAPSRQLPGYGLELLKLVRDLETDQVIAARVRFSTAARTWTAELPARAASGANSTELWADQGVHLSPDGARVAKRWLSRALAHDAPFEDALTHAIWSADQLLVPGLNARPASGAIVHGRADISEDRARDRWRQVLQVLIEQDLLDAQAVLGAFVISPQLARLDRPGFTVVLVNDSSTGKTRTLKVADAIWRQPSIDGHEPNWDRTLNEAMVYLGDHGTMPAFIDETGRINAPDPAKYMSEVLMAVHSGEGRRALRADRGRAQTSNFHLVLGTTSELSLLRDARVGAEARALELTGRPMPNAATADTLMDLTREAYGWPGWWLTQTDWPAPQLPELRATGGVGARLAPSVAAAFAGFAELARVAGVEYEPAPLAQRLLDRLGRERHDERGATAADRLYRNLLDDAATNPALYPELDRSSPLHHRGGDTYAVPAGRDLRGAWKDDNLYVLKKVLRDAATDLHLSAPAALDDLQKDGRLRVLTESRGNLERLMLNGQRVDAYVLVPDRADQHDQPGQDDLAQLA